MAQFAKRRNQCRASPARHEFIDVADLLRHFFVAPIPEIDAVEKRINADAEQVGEQRRAAGADPVDPLLHFLHLLKGDAERGRDRLLRHAGGIAQGAETPGDVNVNFVLVR
ncbi:MAG TPA: hypothetical protein VM867_08335 [Xanthobacteraceae bacterium]|nr:hypothetical protein [Xanthobacteraceae bacterium]